MRENPLPYCFGYVIRYWLNTVSHPFQGQPRRQTSRHCCPTLICTPVITAWGRSGHPEKVKDTSRSRMVTTETPAVVVRRHIDQVRSRLSLASARSSVHQDQGEVNEGSPSATAASTPVDNQVDLTE